MVEYCKTYTGFRNVFYKKIVFSKDNVESSKEADGEGGVKSLMIFLFLWNGSSRVNIHV